MEIKFNEPLKLKKINFSELEEGDFFNFDENRNFVYLRLKGNKYILMNNNYHEYTITNIEYYSGTKVNILNAKLEVSYILQE